MGTPASAQSTPSNLLCIVSIHIIENVNVHNDQNQLSSTSFIKIHQMGMKNSEFCNATYIATRGASELLWAPTSNLNLTKSRWPEVPAQSCHGNRNKWPLEPPQTSGGGNEAHFTDVNQHKRKKSKKWWHSPAFKPPKIVKVMLLT